VSLHVKELLLVLRLSMLFSLESGLLYACLLLVVTVITSISYSPQTRVDGADILAYRIWYPVCILFAVSSSSTKIQVHGMTKGATPGVTSYVNACVCWTRTRGKMKE
jgi:hypothetical protein